jgi:phage shock protein A
MFNDLGKLFRDTWGAFRTELGRREPEDQVAELLAAMRREMVAARAALPELKEAAERTRSELARERESLEDCRRRRSLAERIGDAETARVAGEFAKRHSERAVVLEQRLQTEEAELSLREREAEEMKRRYQDADANRFALLAELRRAQTRRRMRTRLDGEEGPFSDFERMEDAVQSEAAYAQALEDLNGPEPDPDVAHPDAEPDLEKRLRELKRRMERE